MSFNYPYTCPKIDKNITEFKDQLYQHIDNLISDHNELFYEQLDKTKQLEKYIQQHVDNLYNDVEQIFEAVRTSNSDIRDAAEYQINEKQSIIDCLEAQLNQSI